MATCTCAKMLIRTRAQLALQRTSAWWRRVQSQLSSKDLGERPVQQPDAVQQLTVFPLAGVT